jgi:hypothetical protein
MAYLWSMDERVALVHKCIIFPTVIVLTVGVTCLGSVKAGKAITAKTGVTAALKVVRPPYTVEQLAQYAKFEAMRSMPPHHR